MSEQTELNRDKTTPGDVHFYEPALGHGLKHNPFKAVIAPRPIGWISTVDKNGRANLAPYSFFNAIADAPPMLVFASSGLKDTIGNITETREFCFNLTSKALADAMNISSAKVSPEVDEFELANLEKAPCRLIKAPRVAASPVSMECLLSEIIHLQNAQGQKIDHYAVIGEVVGVHIDKAYIKDGVYQTALPHPVMRAGRLTDYVEVTPASMFEMTRPG